MNTFTPLHVHTEYSLLDGAIKISALVAKAKMDGMSAVAITDHGTLYGAMDFYWQAKKSGIKPIIGCEVYLATEGINARTRKMNHMVLLAENRQGYENLVRLVTFANIDGFYYKPRIDKDALNKYKNGLIGLSGCIKGEIPELILQGKMHEADCVAQQYIEILGEGNFFLEIQKNGMTDQDLVNEALQDMSQRLSIPLVATNDCHYLEKEDAYAHEILLCIQTGKTVDDVKRLRFATDQFYFRTQQEMLDAFVDFPGSIENTMSIANRCNLDMDSKSFHFPKYKDLSGLSAEELLLQKTNAGFDRIFNLIKIKNPVADLQVYRARLDYELSVIVGMGFADYFLIVADFIEYANGNNIPVGPGRGSGAGSLVAYAMGITAIDPLEHGLIFERFLNPARISMPDIDIDFCPKGRERVLEYIKDRYGRDRVAQIISFGKLKARAVIRDVGRALGLSSKDVDQIAKLVPKGQDVTLKEVEPYLQELFRTRPEIKKIMDICHVLEGLPRHKSTHASAIVVANKPLIEYLPLACGKDVIYTQFDKDMVEEIGLVKFDLLGLRNLTVIDLCLSNIASMGYTVPDLSIIELNDPLTYDLLSTGQTTGVFQFESPGMQGLLRAFKPERFSDLVALIAVFRPGPLQAGMDKEFVERKHGRKPIEYLLPQLEPILKDTYGVILYQEQVMRIAVDLAGYTMAKADELRKAMGRKKAEVMSEHRSLFLSGCIKNGLDAQKITQIYSQMEKFGGYGFNKSHSAAYALIAYQTAFLKAHHPVEYMTSWLTCSEGDSADIIKFIDESKKMGIPVLPPDINYSGKEFTIENGRIRYGLLGINNVGDKAVDEIIRVRNEKPFTFLSDFSRRVARSAANSLTIKQLINSGAFDSLGTPRQYLLAELGMKGGKIPSDKDDTTIQNEFDALGFYLTEHPLRNCPEITCTFMGYLLFKSNGR